MEALEAMMEKPNWQKFEELVAEIQRELTPSAKIQTAIRKKGRRSNQWRQIDILVQDVIGQFEVSIVIDCKDYKGPVDIKEIESFIGMLDDLGATKGAIIAASGFTKAAIERAKDAGIDTMTMLATGDHPWAKLLSIPTLLREVRLKQYAFRFEMTGMSGGLPLQDFRFLPLYRKNGEFVDYAINFLFDRWTKQKIDIRPGKHEKQILSDEHTYAKASNGSFFRLTLSTDYIVEEVLKLGRTPLLRMRGFLDHQKQHVTTRGFTTGVIDTQNVGEDWEIIPSLEKLAVRPVLVMSSQICPVRFEPSGPRC